MSVMNSNDLELTGQAVERHMSSNSLRTLTFEDLKNMPKPKWAAKGFQQAKGLGLIHGEPGTFKTFLMLDFHLFLANNQRQWFGHAITESRKTLYILAEGVDFFVERMEAWLTLHDDIDKELFRNNFHVYPGAVNILKDSDIDSVISTARDLGCEQVVLDTYSRMLVGQDENKQDVASVAVSNLDRIAEEANAFVWLVHHNNKAGGYRGSTVLDGALDLRVEATKEGKDQVLLSCRKMKNGAEFEPMKFTMQSVKNSVVPIPASNVRWVPEVSPFLTTQTREQEGMFHGLQ